MRDRIRLGLLLIVGAVLAATFVAPAHAYVYWSINGPGGDSTGTTLGRANLDASGITHSFVTGTANPQAMAVDGGHVYWVSGNTSSIARANIDGSGANPTWISLPSNPTGLATDGSYIYWADGNRYIGRAKLDGTGVTRQFVDVGSNSYPTGIGVAGGIIYFTTPFQIKRVPATGGSPTALGPALGGQAYPTALAVKNGYVYFTELNLGTMQPGATIAREQINGSGLNESYVTGLYYPFGLATDGTYLYWADVSQTASAIGRALLGTVTATNRQDSFISEPGGPVGLAVDSKIDQTTTNLSCAPSTVATGSPSTCTATVTDSASSAIASGTVNLTGNGAAFFSGNPCTLTPNGAGSASCVVGAVPTTAGAQAIDAAYSGDPVHSPSTGQVAICAGTAISCDGKIAPSDATPPTIAGSAAVGGTLSCAPGSWSGSTPISYSYQWLRDGGAIAGATSSTYVVAPADTSHGLTCEVNAMNDAGSLSAVSARLLVPALVAAQAVAHAGRAKSLPGGVAKVALRCVGPAVAKCAITLTITVVETFQGKKLVAVSAAARRSRKTITLAAGTATVAGGRSKTVSLKLGRAGQRLLTSRHRLKVTLRIGQRLTGRKTTTISTQKLTLLPRKTHRR